MIGENAYLGENARFAKVGSEAWGTVTEESGTVLFDGVVTLEDDGEGYVKATLLGASAPTSGHYYKITVNGRAYVTGGAFLETTDDTLISANAQECGYSAHSDGRGGEFWGEDVGSPGDEIALTVTDLGEASFFVSPVYVVLNVNSTAYVQAKGVSTFESTNTSVATVAESGDGQYIITGVANGSCGGHFTSADGNVATVSVEVLSGQ